MGYCLHVDVISMRRISVVAVEILRFRLLLVDDFLSYEIFKEYLLGRESPSLSVFYMDIIN